MTTTTTVDIIKKTRSWKMISQIKSDATKKTRKKVPLSVKYKKDIEDMMAGKNCISLEEFKKLYL